MNPHRNLPFSLLSPLIKPIGRNNTAAACDEILECRFLGQRFCTSIDHLIPNGRVLGPVGNQTPMHQPAVIAVFMANNDRHLLLICRRRLFGGNIEARYKRGKIMLKIPANLHVIELECSGDAATHRRTTLLSCQEVAHYACIRESARSISYITSNV